MKSYISILVQIVGTGNINTVSWQNYRRKQETLKQHLEMLILCVFLNDLK
jgi:hypothetical protein